MPARGHRSLQHLIEVLQTIRETGIGLYMRKRSTPPPRTRHVRHARHAIKAALLQGRSVRQIVRETGASIGTTAAVRKVLVEDGAL